MDELLVVDDDIDSCVLLGAILEERYTLHYCMSAQEALAYLQEHSPQLILLDISIPDMSGYDICRQIRLHPKTEHIPVLFLSGHCQLQERLLAYEVGGNDFIGKPFFNQELEQAIAHLLGSQQESAELRAQLANTRQMALAAMNNLGQISSVLYFFQDCLRTNSYAALARCLLGFCQQFEIEASVRISTVHEEYFLSTKGLASPVALSLFDTIALDDQRRRWQIGRVQVFHFHTITVLVPEFGRFGKEDNGRLSEHLMLAVEACAARIEAMDASRASSQQLNEICQLAQQAETALLTVDTLQLHQRQSAATILTDMLADMEQSVAQIGLDPTQQQIVSGTLHRAVDRVFKLYDEGLAIDEHLRQVRSALNQAYN